MATAYIHIPPKDSAVELTETSYQVELTVPANVSGKLARMYVSQAVAHSAILAESLQMLIVESDIPQIYGVSNTSMITTSQTTRYPNRVLCHIAANSVGNSIDKPIMVQLPDGPFNVTFTVRGVNGLNIVGQTDKTPEVFLLLHFSPVDRNTHYENLMSYSTGPFIRM